MENIFEFMYHRVHETIWKPKAVRTAAPARHFTAEKHQKSAGSSQEDRLFGELGISLVAGLSERRGQRPFPKAGTWQTSKALQKAEGETCETPFKGSHSFRLLNRSLDNQASTRVNLEAISHPLPSQPHLETANFSGLELSETREKGSGEERGDNCTLEEVSLASYKKRPKGLVPISSSSMNPGFCLSPISKELGHQRVRPLSLNIAFSMIESPLSLLSLSPLKGNASPYTSSFIGLISTQIWCFNLSATYHGTFGEISSCSGMATLLIKAEGSRLSWLNTPAFIQNAFQGMPQSLTQMSLSGQTLKGILPMPHPKMSKSCLDLLTIQLKGSKVLKTFYGLASMHRICHGRNKDISITYA